MGRDAIPGKRSEHRTEDVVPETGARRRLRQAAAPPPPAITIHPNASEIYRRKIAELAAALASPNIRGQAAKALRDLIEEIAVTAEGDGNAVELAGELAALLGAAGTKNAASLGEAARSALLVAASATSVTCKPCELGYRALPGSPHEEHCPPKAEVVSSNLASKAGVRQGRPR